MTRDPLEYVLNRFEVAALKPVPREDYLEVRRELLDGIIALRRERNQLAGTVDRLIENLEGETRRMRELRGRERKEFPEAKA